MSLALWEFFWNAAGDVWGASADTASSSSGGGGHLNPKNNDIFPRPDDAFWDAREGYLRSKFPERKKTTYRTPDTPIAPSISTRPLSRQAYARPAPVPEPFQFTPLPDTADQGISNIQKAIPELQALKARVNAITANLQKAQSQPVVTQKPAIPLSQKEKKLRAAKKAATIMLRALKRAHGLPLE